MHNLSCSHRCFEFHLHLLGTCKQNFNIRLWYWSRHIQFCRLQAAVLLLSCWSCMGSIFLDLSIEQFHSHRIIKYKNTTKNNTLDIVSTIGAMVFWDRLWSAFVHMHRDYSIRSIHSIHDNPFYWRQWLLSCIIVNLQGYSWVVG